MFHRKEEEWPTEKEGCSPEMEECSTNGMGDTQSSFGYFFTVNSFWSTHYMYGKKVHIELKPKFNSKNIN